MIEVPVPAPGEGVTAGVEAAEVVPEADPEAAPEVALGEGEVTAAEEAEEVEEKLSDTIY